MLPEPEVTDLGTPMTPTRFGINHLNLDRDIRLWPLDTKKVATEEPSTLESVRLVSEFRAESVISEDRVEDVDGNLWRRMLVEADSHVEKLYVEQYWDEEAQMWSNPQVFSGENLSVFTRQRENIPLVQQLLDESLIAYELVSESMPDSRVMRIPVDALTPAELTEVLIQTEEALGDLAAVELDGMMVSARVPSDTRYGDQWHFQNINAEPAWDIETGDNSVVVAVIDSGINPDLAEFNGRLTGGYDFVDDEANLKDLDGHGSMVSSFVGAATDNASLGAGVDWACRIMPVRAGDATFSFTTLVTAVEFATAEGADVINMSLGGFFSSEALTEAILESIGDNVIIVAASGNEAADEVSFPARIPAVIAVGATTRNDDRAGFSSYGPNLDLVAPGALVLGMNSDGNMEFTNGTSFSSPIVAGACALMRAIAPDISPGEASNCLATTARDIGPAEEYGAGILDLGALMLKLRPPAEVPTNVQASDGTVPGMVLVTWDGDPSSVLYRVCRSREGRDDYREIGSTTETFYEDRRASVGVIYDYVVKAENSSGFVSLPSESDDGFRPVPGPPAPTGVNATDMEFPFHVIVTWNQVDEAVSYIVLRSTSETGPFAQIGTTVGTANTTYQDNTPYEEVQYYYAIRAVDEVGLQSPESESDAGSVTDPPPDDHGSVISDATDATSSVGSTGNAVAVTGSIERRSDRDFFEIVIPTTSILTLTTNGVADVFGSIYNEDLVLIDTNQDDGTDQNFEIVTELEPGKYYIEVRGRAFLSRGVYELLMETAPPNPTFAPADWVFIDAPYMYMAADATWHYLSSTGTSYHVDPAGGPWEDLTVYTGTWVFFSPDSPYFFDSSDGAWHYYSPSNEQWVLDVANDTWSVLDLPEAP